MRRTLSTISAAFCHSQGSVSFQRVPLPQTSTTNPLLINVHSVAFTLRDQQLINNGNKTTPFRIGHFFSGVVEEVNNVGNFNIGDSVCGFLQGGGACAQYITVPTNSVLHKPQSISSMEEAAAFAHDAWMALKAVGRQEKKEDFVLVIGADSPVGMYGVVLSRLLKDTRVHAVCRDLDSIRVLKPGPTRIVTLLRGEKWHDALQDTCYDLIIDCIGGSDIWERANNLLRSGGTFVSLYGDAISLSGGPALMPGSGLSELFRNISSSLRGQPLRYQVLNMELELFTGMELVVEALNSNVNVPASSLLSVFKAPEDLQKFVTSDTIHHRPVLNFP